MSSMDKVSNVAGFAAANADYWSEFLSGEDYSAVLSTEEIRALEAARVHIEEFVFALLSLCGRLLVEKFKSEGMTSRGFQPGATKRNQLVALGAPPKIAHKFYRLTFSLGPDEANAAVVLYARLVPKKEHLEKIEKKLAEIGETPRVSGYSVFFAGVPLVEGKALREIAETAVDDMAILLQGAS